MPSSQFFFVEEVENTTVWEEGTLFDAQSDGLGAALPYGGETFGGGSGVSGAVTCGESDWIALGYPTKATWKQLGKPCSPYQGVSQASCPTGFQIDPSSGQCMPIQPALPPGNPPIPNPIACQQIPAGQVGSCLSPISQGQIGTVPGAISTTSGVLSQVEGFFFQHSTLILVGAGLYFLWPTLTKRRR